MRGYLVLAGLLLPLCACTRPEAVRNVATNARPLVVNLERAGASMARHLQEQRQDVMRSTARFEANSSDVAAQTAAIEADWSDAGRKLELERLERYRSGDTAARADPLGSLRSTDPAKAPRVELKLEGLTTAAKSLERLEGEQGLSGEDILAFGMEVSDELKKLEQEAPSQSESQPPSDPQQP